MNRILRLSAVEVTGPHELLVEFDDGTRKVVDLSPLLVGEVFEPLRDPVEFARVRLDPICGTVVWPNGADLAPEALRDLPGRDCGVEG